MSAVGYGAEIHYCLGAVSDVAFYGFDASCVCDAALDQDTLKQRHGCCEDESFFNQLEDEHSPSFVKAVSPPHAVLTSSRVYDSLQLSEEDDHADADLRGPPKTIDLNLLFHRLIFYA